MDKNDKFYIKNFFSNFLILFVCVFFVLILMAKTGYSWPRLLPIRGGSGSVFFTPGSTLEWNEIFSNLLMCAVLSGALAFLISGGFYFAERYPASPNKAVSIYIVGVVFILVCLMMAVFH